MDGNDMGGAGKCPVMHGSNTLHKRGGRGSLDWWPDQLNLRILHQNHPASSPLGPDFDYAEAFADVDVDWLISEDYAAERRETIDMDRVRELALEDETVRRHLEGRRVEKTIYVRGRLVSVVTAKEDK